MSKIVAQGNAAALVENGDVGIELTANGLTAAKAMCALLAEGARAEVKARAAGKDAADRVVWRITVAHLAHQGKSAGVETADAEEAIGWTLRAAEHGKRILAAVQGLLAGKADIGALALADEMIGEIPNIREVGCRGASWYAARNTERELQSWTALKAVALGHVRPKRGGGSRLADVLGMVNI